MKTKLQRAAENLVREVLNAYHRRTSEKDFALPHKAAEDFLRRFLQEHSNGIRVGLDAATFKMTDAKVE